MNGPTPEQAAQFAVMLRNGFPPREALLYFFPDEATVEVIHDLWMRSREVAKAIKVLQDNKDWADLPPERQHYFSLQKHYAELSYLLNTRSYIEATGAEKLKMDTAREALERKLAGTAGQFDEIRKFWDDVRTKRVVLPQAPKVN